jgi:hypothetical protein
MRIKKVLLMAVVGMLLLSCSIFKKNSTNENLYSPNTITKSDTSKKVSVDTIKRNKPKSYKEIITALLAALQRLQ